MLTSHFIASLSRGTVTSQPMLRDSPAGRLTSMGASSVLLAVPLCCLALTTASMARSLALRTVKPAWNLSCSRTTGGRPENSMRSCVDCTDAEPVPNRSMSPLATATMRNEVSESFSGTVASAWPCSSSFTVACQNSSVSNSSRADLPPPPSPPAASALRPKWRLPITCICAVEVETSMPRRVIMASSNFHESFGLSSSRPSSTATSVTSESRGG